jgi:hypothetical protein
LDERLEEIKAGEFDAALDELKALNRDELVERYETRDIEPEE